MVRQAEGAPPEDRDDVVDPIPEQEPPIQHGNPGLVGGQELAVEVDRGHQRNSPRINNSRPSHSRLNRPPCATSSRATSGRRSSSSSPRLTTISPRTSPSDRKSVV